MNHRSLLPIILIVLLLAGIAWFVQSRGSQGAPAPVVTAGEAESGDAPEPLVDGQAAAGGIAGPDGRRAVDANRPVEAEEPEPEGAQDPADEAATTGELIVRARFGDGETAPPASEISVFLEPQGVGRWLPRRRARTDAEGVARFENVGVGTWVVQSASGGYAYHRRKAAEESSEVVLSIPAGYALEGTVRDATGAPLGEAEIWLSDPFSDSRGDVAAKTDAGGAFSIANVSKERYVGARALGFRPSPLKRVDGQPGQTVRVALEIVRGEVGGVSGIVLDTSSQPVVGARVWLGPSHTMSRVRDTSGQWVPGPPPISVRTDAEGRFSARGSVPGMRVLQVRADGFAPHREEVDVPPGQMIERSVVLQEGATLFGVVRGLSSNARNVVVGYDRGGFGGATALVNIEDGTYRIEDARIGELDLELSARPVKMEKRVTTLPGQELQVDFDLDNTRSDRPALRGRVVDETGRPLANWRVMVTEGGTVASGRLTGQTDSEGRFEIPTEWPVVTATASRPGGWTFLPEIFAPNLRPANGDVVLQRGDPARGLAATVIGRVVDAGGNPRPARVEIWHTEYKLYATIDVDPTTGRFKVENVRAGANRITVHCSDDPWINLGDVEVTEGQRLDLGDLVPPVGGRIRGTVRSGDPAVPTPAVVRFTLIREGAQAGAVEYGDGKFASNFVEPGDNYLLVVRAERFMNLTREVEVRARGTTELEIVLDPAALRQVHFSYPAGVEQPPWMNVLVRNAEGRMVWSGGTVPMGGGRAARISVKPGDYTFTAQGPTGRVGEWPLQVHSYADVEPIRITMTR